MKEQLRRKIGALLAWLPDFSRAPVRRQVVIGLIASVLLHLFLLLIIAGITAITPKRRDAVATQQPERKLEVELVPRPNPQPAPVPFTLEEQEPMYIDSTGLAKSDRPPESPLFASDQDMLPGSTIAGQGTVPLPTQMGKERSFTNFKTQNVLLGSSPKPFANLDLSKTTAAQPPAPAQPIYKPQPAREDSPPAQPIAAAAVEEKEPEPAATPNSASLTVDATQKDEIPVMIRPTLMPNPKAPRMEPRPLDQTKPIAEPKEFAALQSPAKPAPPPPRPVVPAESTPPEPTPPEPAPPEPKPVPEKKKATPRAETGYQPHLEQNRIEGSITNKGAPGVAAVKTPLGVYQKQLSQSVGSRWHYYRQQRADLISLGETKVSYWITPEGKITNVKVVLNTANQTFADLCAQSVREAEIPLPPPDVITMMKNGRLEGVFSFILY